MSSLKHKIRAAFRNAVFKRDKFSCVMCGVRAPQDNPESILDAHHITNRNDLPNGGYVLENGVSLCKARCHLLAEEDLENVMKHPGFSKEDLYKKVGSSFEKALETSRKLK
jgi:predicted restriction endonuclease